MGNERIDAVKAEIVRDVLSGKAGVSDPYCGKSPPSSVLDLDVSAPKFYAGAVKRDRKVAGIAERGRVVVESLQDYLSGSFLSSPNLNFQYPTAWESAHKLVLPSFSEGENDVFVSVFSGIGNEYSVKSLLDYPGVKNVVRPFSWFEPTSRKVDRNYTFRTEGEDRILSVYRFPAVWDIGGENSALGVDVDLAYEVLLNQLEPFTSKKIKLGLSRPSSCDIGNNTFRGVVGSRMFKEALLGEGIIKCWLFENMDENGFSRNDIMEWSSRGIKKNGAQKIVPAIRKIGGAHNAALVYQYPGVDLAKIIDGSIKPAGAEKFRRRFRGWS